MNRLFATSLLLVITALSGCGKSNIDSNGVPIISSASQPVVDGKTMTPDAFHAKYCSAPATFEDATCAAVHQFIVERNMNTPAQPFKW